MMPETTAAKLEHYIRLVRQYAGVLDLSSEKHLIEFEKAVERCQPFADATPPNAEVLDIGSGAGLPAIPIAIMRPDVVVTLCEIRSKRAAFLERVVSVLKLPNAHVFQGDVKSLERRFDVITALWLGSLRQIYELSLPRCKANWRMITRKGTELEREWQALLEREWQAMPRHLELETKALDGDARLVIVKGHNEGESD